MADSGRVTPWLFRLVMAWCVACLAVGAVSPRLAAAQTSDNPWSAPLNLSRSGAATNPAVVVDARAVLHVVWQDTFANYRYAQYDGGQWSAPQATSLHLLFGPPPSLEAAAQDPASAGQEPTFVASHGSYTLAFWITPQGALYTSRVLNEHFMNAGAWTTRRLLATQTTALAAGVDASGVIHLVYLKAADTSSGPAGIYAARSTSEGREWTAPSQIYASPYLRHQSLSEANLTLTTGGTAGAPVVYAAWDNRLRKQVFLARSVDRGATWEPPRLVAGPAQGANAAAPHSIRVGALAEQAVVTWQRGGTASTCSALAQFTRDGGATWSEPGAIDQPAGCAETTAFTAGLVNGEAGLFLLSRIQGADYLTAWDGAQWSVPQRQAPLAEFEDPETFESVALGCQRPIEFAARLYVFGCGQGASSDVWVTWRTLEATSDWFSAEAWGPLTAVTSAGPQPVEVKLAATHDGLLHAVFRQRNDPAIYYTRWDGAVWSRVTVVFKVPEGIAGPPALAASPNDELLVVTQSSTGSLYYSRANSQEAIAASNWAGVHPLPVAHAGALNGVDVAWAASGQISVAYAVPVNDSRGVYLFQSVDQGETWSPAVQVFDGAAAGNEVIGPPQLFAAPGEQVYIQWCLYALGVGAELETLSLYSAHSLDAGRTFTAAERVVAAPVAWHTVISDGQGQMHRLWQQSNMAGTVWDQVSTDQGRSWQPVLQLPVDVGRAAVTRDAAGRLHLVTAGPSALRHWQLAGSHWEASAAWPWPVELAQAGQPQLGAVAARHADQLVVLLALPPAADGFGGGLHATIRRLEPAEAAATAVVTPPTPMPATQPPATPSVAAPTEAAATAGSGRAGEGAIAGSTGSQVASPLSVVLVPVAVLLLTVGAVMAWRLFRARSA